MPPHLRSPIPLAALAQELPLSGTLGGYELRSSTTLMRRAQGNDRAAVQIEIAVRGRVDRYGQYALEKTTDPQSGHEVIFSGGWFYPRLRYSRFIKRRPAAGEAQQVFARISGGLGEYVRLLGPSIAIAKVSRTVHAGRPGLQVTLRRAAKGAAPKHRVSLPSARRWRETVVVTELAGEATLDRRTGVVLKARLSARWSYRPPKAGAPKSGIPTVDRTGPAGEMVLDYRHDISNIAAVAPIGAPVGDQVITDIRRRRLELERQMLVGEQEVPASAKPR
jgi:hypothetical protein